MQFTLLLLCFLSCCLKVGLSSSYSLDALSTFDSELTLTTTTVIISTKTLYAASPSTTSLPSSPTLSTTLSQINLQPTTTLAGVTTVWPLIAYAFAATTIIFCFLSVILGGCLCYFCRRVHLSSKLQNSGNGDVGKEYWVSKPLEEKDNEKENVPDGALRHEPSSNTFKNEVMLQIIQEDNQPAITDESIALPPPSTFGPYRKPSLSIEQTSHNDNDVHEEDVDNPMYVPMYPEAIASTNLYPEHTNPLNPETTPPSSAIPTTFEGPPNPVAKLVAEIKAQQSKTSFDNIQQQVPTTTTNGNVSTRVPYQKVYTNQLQPAEPQNAPATTGKKLNYVQIATKFAPAAPLNNNGQATEEDYENAASVRMAKMFKTSSNSPPPAVTSPQSPHYKQPNQFTTHPPKRGPPPNPKPKPSSSKGHSSSISETVPTAFDVQRSRFLSHPGPIGMIIDECDDEHLYMTPRPANQLPWKPYKELDFATVDPNSDYAVPTSYYPDQNDVFYPCSLPN